MISTIAGCALLFALGAFTWTFVEYALHNWRGHRGKGKNQFSKLHLKHHAKVHWFAPTRWKVLAAVKVMIVLAPLASFAMGLPFGISFALGFIAGYGSYELIHRRIHTHPPRGRYSRWTRRNHYIHHFSRPNHNHGVTVPIWDWVFRTSVPSDAFPQVRVPRKHAMDWLVDPETGDVRAELQDDYVLVGRPPKNVGIDESSGREPAAPPRRDAPEANDAAAAAA